MIRTQQGVSALRLMVKDCLTCVSENNATESDPLEIPHALPRLIRILATTEMIIKGLFDDGVEDRVSLDAEEGRCMWPREELEG